MEKRILIIEDNLDIVSLLSCVLEDYDILVDSAYDEVKIKECLSTYNYNIIFLDLNLPGFNTLDFLKNNSHGSNLNFIILTGEVNLCEPDFMSLGIKDFLYKPFSLSDVDQILKKYLY